ncbi:hypothetical protein AB0J52_04470, partial [Spirillospora sp. NPDC049652]
VLGAAAASSVLALTTAPAHATGQTLATTQAITLTNVGNSNLKDNTTGFAWYCTKADGTGTADVGNPPTNPVFRINSLVLVTPSNSPWGGLCSGGYMMIRITADTTTPWAFNVTGSTVSGVTPGALTGVKASIAGDGCRATLAGPGGIGGTLSGSYNNASHSLRVGGPGSTSNLTVQSVNADCDPVMINVGDAFSFNFAYSISPPVVVTVP